MRRLSLPVRIQIAASTAKRADGRRGFTIVAYTGEPLNLPRFDMPVVIDCASLDLSVQSVPALLDHQPDLNAIVGQVEAIKATKDKPPIIATGYFTPTNDPNDAATFVMAKADAGFVWQGSVGGNQASLDRIEAGQTVKVNGRTYSGPCYVARGTHFREISFTVLGADRHTSVAARHISTQIRGTAAMDEGFRNWLLALGFDSPESLTAIQRANLEIKYRESGTDEPDGLSRGGSPAVANPTNATAVLPRIRSNATGRGPRVIIRNTPTREVMQAAMILRFGGDAYLDHPAYRRTAAAEMLPAWLRANANDANKNRIIEAAFRMTDIDPIGLARECCRLDGRDVQGRDAAIQAAFSGSTLSNIFSTNVNAILLATYDETPDSTAGWTSENFDVPNYLLQERTRMVKSAGLSKQPAGTEADHTTRSDTMEQYKIARYSRQFELDEIDFLNDELGGLKDIPVEMGRAAARLRPDLVYSVLLANPNISETGRALCNSTDGNKKTGAAFTAATLRAAVAAMWLFQENGVNLNLAPTHLIVPPTLKHNADELINSSQIFVKGSTDAERGTDNALKADNLALASDSRLENGVTDPDSGTAYAGSSSTWWLACKNARTIEVGYLRGTGGAPRVRSGQLNRGKFGLWWDVQLSVGAKALDYRGFVRNEA